MSDALRERIARERREMNLRPWQFAPSEIDAGPCPYPAGSAGARGWAQAQQWRAEIRERDPRDFEA